jgi:transposase
VILWREGFEIVSRNLFWLSDEKWKRIEPFLPTDVRGVVDDRRVISGIVQVLKSGCRWCDCPAAYGPLTTIYNRFVRWARRGIWENLFRKFAGTASSAHTQMIDSIHSLTPDALSSGQQGLQTQKSHRTQFCKLKNWRRIATRYDRYAQNYLSGLALAAIMIAWI